MLLKETPSKIDSDPVETAMPCSDLTESEYSFLSESAIISTDPAICTTFRLMKSGQPSVSMNWGTFRPNSDSSPVKGSVASFDTGSTDTVMIVG